MAVPFLPAFGAAIAPRPYPRHPMLLRIGDAAEGLGQACAGFDLLADDDVLVATVSHAWKVQGDRRGRDGVAAAGVK